MVDAKEKTRLARLRAEMDIFNKYSDNAISKVTAAEEQVEKAYDSGNAQAINVALANQEKVKKDVGEENYNKAVEMRNTLEDVRVQVEIVPIFKLPDSDKEVTSDQMHDLLEKQLGVNFETEVILEVKPVF
jgi:hypothetical protein